MRVGGRIVGVSPARYDARDPIPNFEIRDSCAASATLPEASNPVIKVAVEAIYLPRIISSSAKVMPAAFTCIKTLFFDGVRSKDIGC